MMSEQKVQIQTEKKKKWIHDHDTVVQVEPFHIPY